jgi:hypothetical protein
MGFFDIFKKNSKSSQATSDNGILEPTFLENYTVQIQNPKDLHSHEWRRRLITPSGQTKFQIKFYGKIHEEYKNLIVSTDFAPLLIFAVDPITGQEILMFDGCKHGYNALFCDTFSEEQVTSRPATNLYRQNGNDTFEIVISTYNGVDYEAEFANEIDENGLIEINNGTKIEIEEVKRNGYDTLQIWATGKDGTTINVLSEELA